MARVVFEALDPGRMTDAGMYAWAAIIAIVSLGVSYAIAVAWQRRKR